MNVCCRDIFSTNVGLQRVNSMRFGWKNCLNPLYAAQCNNNIQSFVHDSVTSTSKQDIFQYSEATDSDFTEDLEKCFLGTTCILFEFVAEYIFQLHHNV